MFFRVRIAVIDPRTQQEVSPQYIVLSHPIRVVSKPDQVKKKIKKRKRAPTDNLMDTLTRIEAQQKEQQRLLKKLCLPSSGPSCTLSFHSLTIASLLQFILLLLLTTLPPSFFFEFTI
jgi:hypothetical protein